ncbi:MAG: class I SAM-dependent methyltransferase [Synechococcales bacterium]|nr:class I SAM-dependent methyltransferase [Synechococcales bacterium]
MNENLLNETFNPSESYYRKAQLDLDFWFQVAQVDYEELIKKYSFDELFCSLNQDRINLLDLGCGTAKFPSLLDRAIVSNIHVSADLLDISESCLEIAKSQYNFLKHFKVNKTYLSAIENLHLSISGCHDYDVIWAIHSLWTIDKSKVKDMYLYCLSLLKANGKLLIYQLSQDSDYHKFYSFYRDHYLKPDSSTTVLTSEDHQKILDALRVKYEIVKLHFSHKIDAERQDLLKFYLQKCILNEDPDVTGRFHTLLEEGFDRDKKQYEFAQVVDLLIIEKFENK